MRQAIGHHLRLARMGHVLLEVLPGAALVVGRADGPSVTVAPLGDPRADVLPCQHRAALERALAAGLQRTYAHALGLASGGELSIRLDTPTGTDIGSGVFAFDDLAARRVLTTTTLCAEHAAAAARAARTTAAPARGGPSPVPVRAEVGCDAGLGVTVLSWTHLPHPAVLGAVEDIARAAAAACAVEELLATL